MPQQDAPTNRAKNSPWPPAPVHPWCLSCRRTDGQKVLDCLKPLSIVELQWNDVIAQITDLWRKQRQTNSNYRSVKSAESVKWSATTRCSDQPNEKTALGRPRGSSMHTADGHRLRRFWANLVKVSFLNSNWHHCTSSREVYWPRDLGMHIEAEATVIPVIRNDSSLTLTRR